MSRYGFNPGDQCYKYRLASLLSNPATSQTDVWLADDQATQTRVALKILDAQYVALPDRLYEAQFGAKLRHINLCEVVGADVFQWQTSAPVAPAITFAAIAFRFQPNGACTKYLEGPGMLPVDAVHRLLLDVLAGLEYLHEQGWQHNDIKPANILVGIHQEFMLTDYGIAWAPNMGLANNAFYKPHIAPESIKGNVGAYTSQHQPTAHTDLYQLALTAYRLLNGVSYIRQTFDQMSAAGQEDGFFDLVKQGRIPDCHAYHPSIPQRLRQIVNTAMDPDPGNRYPSALAMRRELEKLHYPHVWRFEPAGNMILTKLGVQHRIEKSQCGGKLDVRLVKTFQSGRVVRPTKFVKTKLTPAQAESHVKRIMQECLKC